LLGTGTIYNHVIRKKVSAFPLIVLLTPCNYLGGNL
jgi:hypothetical protein